MKGPVMSKACRLLALTILLLPALPAPAADVKDDPNALTLQVTALEMLHRFQASPEQLGDLLKLAKTTAPKEAARKAAKVSVLYRKTLTELRDAYVNGDEDAIL